MGYAEITCSVFSCLHCIYLKKKTFHFIRYFITRENPLRVTEGHAADALDVVITKSISP